MKRLFRVIAVASVIAAMGLFMTACGGKEQTSEETTAAQTTVQTTAAAQETTAPAEKPTVQQTTAAQETTAAAKSNNEKKSSAAESKASDNSSEAEENESDNGSGEAFAGISEEDARAMALLDLVTEEPTVESCKQGKDQDGADCWVIIMKDAENDRYISYVNADGSTTLPYTE